MSRRTHAALVGAFVALWIAHHYLPALHGFDSMLGLDRHTWDRVLALAAVAYTCVALGQRWGVAVLMLLSAAMLPRALYMSPHPVDAAVEATVVVAAGVAFCVWVKAQERQRQLLRLNMERLETAQQRLQAQVRATMEREKKLALLSCFSARLSTTLDLEGILDTSLDMVRDTMQVEIVIIFRLDRDARVLRVAAYRGVDERFAAAIDEIAVGEGFNGRVAQSGEPLVVDDSANDPRLTRSAVKEEKLVTQVSVPLVAQGKIVGTFCAATRVRRTFSRDDVELFSIIGNQIGIAMENSRLYEEQRAIVEREKEMHENLRHYVQQITKAQEEERLRIASELHDSTAQNLIAIVRKIEDYAERRRDMPMTESRFLWSLEEEVKGVLEEIRHFSRILRPPMLDHLGLLPALEWLLEEMEANEGIRTRLAVEGEKRRLRPEVELTVFRITQEALRNAARHAHAEAVEVVVRFGHREVCVTVTDDGVGFDMPSSGSELLKRGKLGIAGMFERARLVGGSVEVTSRKGEGTGVSVRTPVDAPVLHGAAQGGGFATWGR